jgi:hypothetical protein
VRARHVPIKDLVATQNHLAIAALEPTHKVAHDADRLIHVVRFNGQLFVEDGHHRVVRERLAGADWINARVHDLDGTPPPGDAVTSADDQADLPGLVWVEGKGYRSVHLARALESAGGRVDWHRWSPGTSDRPGAPLPYRDAS